MGAEISRNDVGTPACSNVRLIRRECEVANRQSESNAKTRNRVPLSSRDAWTSRSSAVGSANGSK